MTALLQGTLLVMLYSRSELGSDHPSEKYVINVFFYRIFMGFNALFWRLFNNIFEKAIIVWSQP